MRCHHCDSEMQQTDLVTEGHVRQDWYHCPVCRASQTISQPWEAPLRRIGDHQRCSCDRRERGRGYRGLS